ncbi:MAG: type II toxin-antitoxin system RelE family toxin [Actinomycetota bacterium]
MENQPYFCPCARPRDHHQARPPGRRHAEPRGRRGGPCGVCRRRWRCRPSSSSTVRRPATRPGPGRPLRFELEGRHSAYRGDYRVVCRIDHPRRRVTVLAVGHRADIYRRG